MGGLCLVLWVVLSKIVMYVKFDCFGSAWFFAFCSTNDRTASLRSEGVFDSFVNSAALERATSRSLSHMAAPTPPAEPAKQPDRRSNSSNSKRSFVMLTRRGKFRYFVSFFDHDGPPCAFVVASREKFPTMTVWSRLQEALSEFALCDG